MIGKNTILSLLVACGLLLVSPAANAQGANGQCTSIVAQITGAYNQIDQGINVVNNKHSDYREQLEAACASDPALSKAWLEGDWSVIRGHPISLYC